MIIFMHGVIPHNHVNEQKDDCSSVLHCCHESEQDLPGQLLPETNHDDQHSIICHFSTVPYNHLDNDSSFFIVTEVSFLPPAEESNKSIITYHLSFAEQDRHTPDNRRGPPSLMG